jgi:hypothetical protein
MTQDYAAPCLSARAFLQSAYTMAESRDYTKAIALAWHGVQQAHDFARSLEQARLAADKRRA